jgi:hypothetical protein
MRLNSEKSKELTSVDGTSRRAGTPRGLPPGFELAEDDRHLKVKNFHIPAFKRNVSSSVDNAGGQLMCVSCTANHLYDGASPVCLILSDQNFPPALPAIEGQCCVIIRAEDCLLSELPGMLKEYFGGLPGCLPEGSMVMFGSLSHLAKRGLENYAEECVKIKKVITNMLPGSCTVIHMVFVPLGGIEGEATVRDLYDLDSWLRGAGHSGENLRLSRAEFWTLCTDESVPESNCNGTKVLYMLESISSSTKIRTVAGAPHVKLPVSIAAFNHEKETRIINTLMREINDSFAMNLDENPDLERSSSQVYTSDDVQKRVFLIGASHVKRIVGGLVALNQDIVDLSRPGWKADTGKLDDIAARLSQYDLSGSDIVVIDPLANNVVCGTGTGGKLTEQIKIDGKWHVSGSLAYEPKSVLRSVLNEVAAKLFSGAEPTLLVFSPLPRYVIEPCCASNDHVQNLGSTEYITELEQNVEMIDELLAAWSQNVNSRSEILNFRAVADNPDAPIPELTVQGEPMWPAGDPVHAAGQYYAEMASLVAESVRNIVLDDGGLPPPAKRPKLASIVVRRENEKPQASNIRHRASWSTGKLPPVRARGRGNGGSRGFRPFSHGRAGWQARGWALRGRGRGGR